MNIGGWGACCFAAGVTICFTESKWISTKTNEKNSTDTPTQVFPFCSHFLLTTLHNYALSAASPLSPIHRHKFNHCAECWK
jgi:hypothetical protein